MAQGMGGLLAALVACGFLLTGCSPNAAGPSPSTAESPTVPAPAESTTVQPTPEDAATSTTVAPKVTRLADSVGSLEEVLAAVETAGLECAWVPDSANPEFIARCEAPRVWVMHDPQAPGDMALMESTGGLWDQLFDGRVLHGDNWIVGADRDAFDELVSIGGVVGAP